VEGPEVSRPGVPVTVERLMERSVRTESGCLEWQGATTSGRGGYGVIGSMGKVVYVHRAAFELLVGPIPDGLVIDHLCRNRTCWEPAHLEAVTHRINILRGTGASARNARKGKRTAA